MPRALLLLVALLCPLCLCLAGCPWDPTAGQASGLFGPDAFGSVSGASSSGSTGPGGGAGGDDGAPDGVADALTTDGGDVVVTVCDPTCPPGYVGSWLGATPNGCGGNGCAVPGLLRICALAGLSVAAACDLATACAGGRKLLATYAACDCPGGSLFLCS